jgi:hypothetical protein
MAVSTNVAVEELEKMGKKGWTALTSLLISDIVWCEPKKNSQSCSFVRSILCVLYICSYNLLYMPLDKDFKEHR